MSMTREFAEAIVKAHTTTYMTGCHNESWMASACVHCNATNYSGTITHKKSCVVEKAKKFLAKKQEQTVSVGVETDRDSLVKSVDIEEDR